MRFSLVALFAIGCVATPDDIAVEESFRAPAIAIEWDAVPEGGCEDADKAELELVRVEGQPYLGALVDREGAVQCVDALAVLVQEIDTLGIAPRAGDPSPQPAMPVDRVYAEGEALGVPVVQPEPVPPAQPVFLPEHGDPTPTPVVREDPTPTPVTED